MPDIDHPRDCNCSICDLCGEMMGLWRHRRFAIKRQISGNQAVESLICGMLGYTGKLAGPERKRLVKIAAETRTAIEKGRDVPPQASPISGAIWPFVIKNAEGRLPWDEMRKSRQQEMCRLARQFPVWPAWGSNVLGFSPLGLGVIVGHAHNLSRYPTKDKLNARLMVALRDWKNDGNWVRQGFVPANLSREERRKAYIEHAYNPQRHGDLYPFLYDSLIKGQWRGEVDCVPKKGTKKFGPRQPCPAHALGPYGVYYGTKKAEYLERYANEKGGRYHADIGARRYAAKMFIRDLWRAWREAA